jgi:5,10-methylenetetrahydrofolate reductase
LRTFRRALQRDAFCCTAELFLPRQATAGDALRQAAELAPHVDGIQLAENPHDWVQISPPAVAALLLREGIDPVSRLNCRDRNRIALQSDLLGLRAIGASTVILDRGEAIPAGQEPQAKAVFDTAAHEYVAMAHAMNEEGSFAVKDELVIGTSVDVVEPGPLWDSASLVASIGAGARFLQTRLCFDSGLLRRHMQRMVEEKFTWNCAIIVTLAPLPSAETARWMAENIPGSVIPEAIIERLENAADPEREGIDICAELISDSAGIPGISGVNLLSAGKPQAVASAIESSGVMRQR